MTVPSRDDVLAAAHDYAGRGWRVIALHHVREDGACSCGRDGCNSAGKHPIQNRWQETAPMGGADIQATFEDDDHNIGIATGEPSGFWVLDIDLDKPGTMERVKTMQAGRKLPNTWIVKTGGGGFQYYFQMPDFQVTNSAKRLPDGVDVRGTGGQVVAPPSISGKGPYTLAAGFDVAPAPDWLLELVRPLPPAAPVDLETLPKLTDLPATEQTRLGVYVDRVVMAERERLHECKEKGWGGPGWNDTTFQVACTLIELANSPWAPLTMEEAHAVVLANAPRDRGFDDAAVEGCFTSALKKVAGQGRALPPNRDREVVFPGDPLTDPSARSTPPEGVAPTPGSSTPDEATPRDRTDLGNARRLVDTYGHVLRYIPQAKEWAAYSEGLWEQKGSAGRTAAQRMLETLFEREGHLYDDTPTGENNDGPSEREKFFKWAKAQQMGPRINACVDQATALEELQAKMTDFDADPMLFNCANGVIDMRTGELLDHDPKYLMMLQSKIAYDPAAQAPRWQAFLERCLPDPEIRAYLQRATGYSLTGSMAEQAMFLHHGPGANGKSVYLVVASMLAGQYAQVVPRETLLAKGSTPEHPTSVARMHGKRFMQASETGVGRRLDEETVKGLTGGEQQTARFMGANFFDFTPTGKIHLVTNHLPRLTDAESIWRRLHLIAWTQTIPVAERDPRLATEEYWIEAGEAPGILAWAVQGAVLWGQEGRLHMPKSMVDDLAEYRTDQDILGEFVTLRLEKDEHGYAAISDIYGAYQNWCFGNGIKNVMTSPDLTRALAERGFVKHRRAKDRGFRARVLPVGEGSFDPLVAH